jgi:hypothetical protein
MHTKLFSAFPRYELGVEIEMVRETEIVREMEMVREMRDTEISEGRWRYRD